MDLVSLHAMYKSPEYKQGYKDGQKASESENKENLDTAHDLLQEIAWSGIEWGDKRISWVPVQVNKNTLREIDEWLKKK